MLPSTWFSSVRDRLANSWFLAISILLHMVLVVALGTTVLFEFEKEPPDLVAYEGLLQPKDSAQQPAPDPSRNPSPADFVRGYVPPASSGEQSPLERILKNSQPSDLNFIAPGQHTGPSQPKPEIAEMPRDFQPHAASPVQLTSDDLSRIGEFTNWSSDATPGKPLTQRRFAFKAYLGRYADGNWQSTVAIRNGKIAAGSLPNLLFLMSKWSGDRIQTNERNVEAIPLDSPALLADRPPFVFMTGTRDFKLTHPEVENLRRYLRSGGAVWGDSSVPGQRSAFDTAFRREMKRVLGEAASEFESLPSNHPIFTAGYFSRLKEAPSGLNNYRETVDVLRWSGEIAVIHTRNDYGDMWRVGLDEKGEVDLSKNERGEFVATDPALWSHRGVYVRNLEPPAVKQSFEFGINVVVHLLTRWESRTAMSKKL